MGKNICPQTEKYYLIGVIINMVPFERPKRYRDERSDSGWIEPRDPTPEEVEKSKLKAYLKAQKDYHKSILKNNKMSAREELTHAGKTLLREGGKVIDGFLDANSKIGNAVIRDIHKHSLEGEFERNITQLLFEQNKAKAKQARKTSSRPRKLLEVKDVNGKTVIVDERDWRKSTGRKW